MKKKKLKPYEQFSEFNILDRNEYDHSTFYIVMGVVDNSNRRDDYLLATREMIYKIYSGDPYVYGLFILE
jgi:hypothetical protein